jgi:hypothetical protein
LKILANSDLSFVSGGDRWCDTPEGKSTVDGAPAQGGNSSEACVDSTVRVNGIPTEICVVVRRRAQ